MNEAKAEIEKLYEQFKLSEALKTIYSLIWDDFCSWYLEWAKPAMNESIDTEIYQRTIEFFDELLLLLHPFMPFVTEEIYHQLKERSGGDDICVKLELPMNQSSIGQSSILNDGLLLKNVITAIRDARNKNNLKPKDTIKLFIQAEDISSYKKFENILAKQVNAETVSYTDETIAGSIAISFEKDKFFLQSDQQQDTAIVKAELQKELEYQLRFLESVEKKLGNERFVQNAKPEVVELERKKKADAEARIKTIREMMEAGG